MFEPISKSCFWTIFYCFGFWLKPLSCGFSKDGIFNPTPPCKFWKTMCEHNCTNWKEWVRDVFCLCSGRTKPQNNRKKTEIWTPKQYLIKQKPLSCFFWQKTTQKTIPTSWNKNQQTQRKTKINKPCTQNIDNCEDHHVFANKLKPQQKNTTQITKNN